MALTLRLNTKRVIVRVSKAFLDESLSGRCRQYFKFELRDDQTGRAQLVRYGERERPASRNRYELEAQVADAPRTVPMLPAPIQIAVGANKAKT